MRPGDFLSCCHCVGDDVYDFCDGDCDGGDRCGDDRCCDGDGDGGANDAHPPLAPRQKHRGDRPSPLASYPKKILPQYFADPTNASGH